VRPWVQSHWEGGRENGREGKKEGSKSISLFCWENEEFDLNMVSY
jgi:hypothetical protein